jgi:hypothetical protein
MEKTQNRCISGRRTKRGVALSVMLLPKRENLLFFSRRYHLDTSLCTNMSYGLAMPLGSHGNTNSSLGITNMGSSLSIHHLVPLVGRIVTKEVIH